MNNCSFFSFACRRAAWLYAAPAAPGLSGYPCRSCLRPDLTSAFLQPFTFLSAFTVFVRRPGVSLYKRLGQ